MVQITMLILMDDGAHLVLNNGPCPWSEFRVQAAAALLAHMCSSPEPHCEPISAVFAHDCHFHTLDTAARVYEVLQMSPPLRGVAASA